MNDPDPVDETDLLRQELERLGFHAPPDAEDLGLPWRDAESFFAPGLPPSEVVGQISVSPGRKRMRWLRPVVGALATAAVVAVFALVLRQGDDAQQPNPPSTDILTVAQIVDAAGTAAGANPDDAGKATYWRVHSRTQQADIGPAEQTLWLGHKRAGLLVEDGVNTPLPPATFGLAARRLTWSEIQRLPTDPDALGAVLRGATEARDSEDWQVFKAAGDLLTQTPAPPQVRQALWKLMGDVPGVTRTGPTADSAGRRGEGISMKTPGAGTITYVIDVDGGLLLETRWDQTPSGGDSSWTTYLDQGPAVQLPRSR